MERHIKMNQDRAFFSIKLLHTVIFIIMSAGVFFILYCGIAGIKNRVLLISIVLILIEGLALFLNKFECPLTTLAKKYDDQHERYSDIFLPRWFTPFVVPVFTALFLIGLILVILNRIS